MSTLPLTIQTSDESSPPPRASENRLTLLPDMTALEKVEHVIGPILQMIGQAVVALMIPLMGYVGWTLLNVEKGMVKQEAQFQMVNYRLDAMQTVMMEQASNRYTVRDASQDSEILKLKLSTVNDRLERLERPTASARAAVSAPARAAITR